MGSGAWVLEVCSQERGKMSKNQRRGQLTGKGQRMNQPLKQEAGVDE